MQTALIIGSLLAGTAFAEQAKPVKEVAGRTLGQWVVDLDSPNEFVRLRAVKSLLPFGKAAVPPLSRALGDKHIGVQYWAASHLGDLKTAPKPAIATLRKMEAGKNEALAMAAAYALCQIEKPDGHITLLMLRLEYPERGMACCAAEFLGKLGTKAKAAVPALEAAYKRHDRKPGEKGKASADYHIRGASQNALRLILGKWQPK